jgi:predicted metalloprotease with PDZ domain
LVRGKFIFRLLHRVIMQATDGQWIDHINRNALDNRLSNLRFTDRAGNSRNCGLKGSKVGLKGVVERSSAGGPKYIATINETKNGIKTQHYLGTFPDKWKAAKAYDKAAVRIFREFAATNKDLGLLP